MSILDAYDDVRAFHVAFNHPAPEQVSTQPADRATKRTNWIDEEATEFTDAKTLEDQIDACLDGLYFNLGGLVECGARGELVDYETMEPHHIVRSADQPKIGKLNDSVVGVYTKEMHEAADDLRADAGESEVQVDCYLSGLDLNLEALALLGVAWKPLFDIVHGANMAKLWDVDGVKTAVYHPDGKVKKPAGWTAPEPQLMAEILRQVDAG